jgi:hypothetical protein
MHIDAMSAYGALDYVPNKEKLLCFVRNLSVMNTEIKALQESMKDPPSQCEAAQAALADVSARVRDMMADVQSRFTIQMHGDTHGATGGAGALAGPDDATGPHLLAIGCTPQHETHLRDWVSAAIGATQAAQLRLLYKATRDGFMAKDYHRACGGYSRLLCVIREKERGWLFGGFTSVPAASTQARNEHVDATAFLFTLTNPHGIPPTKYVTKAGAPAVCTHASCLFALGYKIGAGYDLVIRTESNINTSKLLPYYRTHIYAY